MQICEIKSTGSFNNPHVVGDIKHIKLSDRFNCRYGKHIYIKVNKIVDLTFIDNGHQILSDNLVILSDEENIVFEQIKIQRLDEEHYCSLGFSGIAFFKPIKNITKIFNIDLKNVRGDYKVFSIKIINPKEHTYIIDNTFNLDYSRKWSIRKNNKNQIVKFKIKDSEEEYELKKINSQFERFSFELEIENEYLELESFNIEFDKKRKNQLYESLLLEHKIPFFPLNFEFLDLTIDSNLPNNYKNYLPYFYILQCNVTIKTQYDILFNIIFESSHIKTVNKNPLSFECHLVDNYTYHRIEEKNKFYNIENDYLLEDIPFEAYKRNLFPNFLNNIFKKLYQPSSLLNLSSYIVMLFFLIIVNCIMFEQKDMLPTDPVSTQTYLFDTMKRQHKDVNIESRESWSYVEGYQQYNPFLYAFELALPISIGQNQTWAPIFDEKRKYMNIYYYISKIISNLLWFLIAYNIYKLWDKKKND